MNDDDRQTEQARHLHVLEAKLVAATRPDEVIAIARQAPTSKLALPQIMRAFAVSEEQAAIILDSQFRVTTLKAREQIEDEIRALKALPQHDRGDRHRGRPSGRGVPADVGDGPAAP